jgi:hypothetical protein
MPLEQQLAAAVDVVRVRAKRRIVGAYMSRIGEAAQSPNSQKAMTRLLAKAHSIVARGCYTIDFVHTSESIF